MISRELEAEILRLYHAEHWRIGTLARQLRIHHDTVRRVLTQAGIPATAQSTRGSMADPFVPFIQDTLARYPSLRASRLYDMVRERVQRGRLKGQAAVGVRVGRVLNKYKVGKHFALEISYNRFEFQRLLEQIAAEAALDGIYVIRTAVPKKRKRPTGYWSRLGG